MTPGLHHGVPMADYLALDALGSTRLGWLAVSPLHYRYRLGSPREETDATRLGTALHMAVLEPQRFAEQYACEPDPAMVAPGNAKPRATNAYRAAVADMEAAGFTVLRADVRATVGGMANAVLGHPHAARLLERAPEREVTALWDLDGRPCRARVDLLGSNVAADLKTTRSLKTFSPWELTRYGYYRQASWYLDGLRRLGCYVERFFFIAVESTPPHDVGVFVMDPATLDIGLIECESLLKKLVECEHAGEWPGMFPDVQQAQLSDALVAQLVED
jgi:exodeoxyribonuclease VIII